MRVAVIPADPPVRHSSTLPGRPKNHSSDRIFPRQWVISDCAGVPNKSSPPGWVKQNVILKGRFCETTRRVDLTNTYMQRLSRPDHDPAG